MYTVTFCFTQHDYFVPGCVDPAMMSDVTKRFTLQEPVPQAGWLMFGNPRSPLVRDH